MYVHLQSVCTCLHSFTLSLHSFVQYRCAFSFVYVYTVHHLQQVCTCMHSCVLVFMVVCMSAPGTTCFHVPVLVCIWHLSFSLISAWHHLFLFACTCLVCI